MAVGYSGQNGQSGMYRDITMTFLCFGDSLSVHETLTTASSSLISRVNAARASNGLKGSLVRDPVYSSISHEIDLRVTWSNSPQREGSM